MDFTLTQAYTISNNTFAALQSFICRTDSPIKTWHYLSKIPGNKRDLATWHRKSRKGEENWPADSLSRWESYLWGT